MTDNRHHFQISATIRGAGADYAGELETQEIRAWSLPEALRAAAELPLAAWFPPEEEATPPATQPERRTG